MNSLNNILAGIFLRWCLAQILAVILVILIKAGPLATVLSIVIANFAATWLVVDYMRKYYGIQIKKIELEVLQAQINPHFLFNTLNAVITYSRTNPEIARRLLIRLASFFRYALKRHGNFNSLKEEIDYVNTYLVLEKARFREKIRIQRDIDTNLLDCQVPVLILQPLVENAIKHGIQPKDGTGTVHIAARLLNGEIQFIIRDDGVGIKKDKIPEVLLPGFGSGNGVGLSNVHERLKYLFGRSYGLQIESDENMGTSVYFKVPLKFSADGKGGLTGEAQSADCR
ncbi:MAG: Sensor histidine kinase YpdA [Pelotomaculum sp. PtaU1.Bin035]|nr:MAG: Sensor histidine kinase YpdA [Pelotomaculum sp. PtaU1.Bin035]